MQNIVEFIKEEMSNRGMTYDLLAERVGTTRQNLWTKLNKNTRPNFETVRKILAALDYDLVVEKKKGAADPGEKEIADFLQVQMKNRSAMNVFRHCFQQWDIHWN